MARNSFTAPTASSCATILQVLMTLILAAGYVAISPAYARVSALQPGWNEIVPSVRIPPTLQSRRTPLDTLATARVIFQLKSGAGLGNVSAFCEEAGLLCDQTINVSSVMLFALGPYLLPSDEAMHAIDLALFFGEGQLALGNRISLSKQPTPVPGRAFLPLALENELPFSSQTLPQLLAYFHFTNTSNMARNMAEALKVCETAAMEDETKACVASLESMEEFAASVIGTWDLETLVSAEIEKLEPEEMLTVKGVTEMKAARRGAVACHNAMFPYQVFYCHELRGTRTFKVELQTDHEGEQLLTVVASCHEEGKLKDLLKQLFAKLNVKVGELICHWSLGDNVVWIPAAVSSNFVTTPTEIV